MLKKSDKILFLIIGIVIIGGFLYQYIADKDVGNKVVEIKIDGEIYEKVELNNLDTTEIIHIENEYGINHIEVDNKGAKVIYANCPDQVCVRTGRIEKPGPIIACLPHKLSVEIVGDTEDELDAISQ